MALQQTSKCDSDQIKLNDGKNDGELYIYDLFQDKAGKAEYMLG